MKSTSNQFQNLGNGTYRVTGARVSPTTGRYLTASGKSGEWTSKTGSTSAEQKVTRHS
jgi:hypothetical protein